MIKPTLTQAKELARGCTVVPIALEIFSDQKTPIEVLRAVRSQGQPCFLLESVSGQDSWGRYTFLGFAPVECIREQGGAIVSTRGEQTTLLGSDPLAILRDELARFKAPPLPDLPPFTGGFVGYFGYDFVKNLIPGLTLGAINDAGFRQLHLMRFDKVIAFDHFKQKIFLIANIPTQSIEESYIEAVAGLKDIERLILGACPDDEPPGSCGEFAAQLDRKRFGEITERVKDHIAGGDIFQAVVSNRFTAPFSGSLLGAYRMLRTINPSPYMCYLKTDDLEIACASPETLVALRQGCLSSYPLAGSCPRGKTQAEDSELIANLLQNEKELAEHDMLVDLARNDIGQLSEFGSVQVREYRQVKRFSHVSHISSKVAGRLRQGLGPVDVIAATLPAGTLSGAPKKRAIEIIDACEGLARGPYGGAIGYIDFAGNMDVCIGIRMAVLKGGKVYVQAGAGIVADSAPDKEYQEVLNKAGAVMQALGGAVPCC